MSYDPYGMPLGTQPDDFGFTGEQTDENGSVFLRARYYEPQLGIFSALDPWEGISNRPMSLNGYSWVEGNVINATDPTGRMPLGFSRESKGYGFRLNVKWNPIYWNLQNPRVIQSMNSGLCYDGGSKAGAGLRVGNVNKSDPRFYSRGGGSDIQQGGSETPTPTQVPNVSQNITYTSNERCNLISEQGNRLKADRSLDNQGCERMARLIEFASDNFDYENARDLSDDISCALTGHRGPITWYWATFGGGLDGLGTGDSQNQRLPDGYLGFYEDFTHNQDFHFWVYVNSAAQGGLWAAGLAAWANDLHECTGLHAGWPLFDHDDPLATQPDAMLGLAGVLIGYAINQGIVSASDLGSYVRDRICNMTPDAVRLYDMLPADAYSEGNYGCPAIKNTVP